MHNFVSYVYLMFSWLTAYIKLCTVMSLKACAQCTLRLHCHVLSDLCACVLLFVFVYLYNNWTMRSLPHFAQARHFRLPPVVFKTPVRRQSFGHWTLLNLFDWSEYSCSLRAANFANCETLDTPPVVFKTPVRRQSIGHWILLNTFDLSEHFSSFITAKFETCEILDTPVLEAFPATLLKV